MPYNIGGKSALLLIESLPLQQSDREFRGFLRISCSLKLEAQMSKVLPQIPSFHTVSVQVCCFYAHARMHVQYL